MCLCSLNGTRDEQKEKKIMNKQLQKARNFFKENLPDMSISPQEVRVAAEKMYAKLPVADDIIVQEIEIDGMKAEWTISPGVKEERVLLYLHGGGFIFGSPATHRGEVSEIGRAAKARTLTIDYRLAPEHPFPAPIEDAVKAYVWLLDQGTKPENITVAGESAGGSMTATLMISLRDSGIPLPAAAVLISPWIDMGQSGESYISKEGIDPINTKESCKYLATTYLNGVDPKAPYASPIYAPLHGLSPMYIMVGEAEVMLTEALTFANKAAYEGANVRLEVWPQMIHNWPLWHSFLPEGKEAIKKSRGIYG